ncbi:hypothetical protein J4468_00965 [Candidatus Woesearchaeota archaeon]|nr:hypothetical protein [Candidatus Woesearchaeota archaeon]
MDPLSYMLGILFNSIRVCSVYRLNREIQLIQKYKEECRYEFAEYVQITDLFGLEGILQKTAEKSKIEWGTLLQEQSFKHYVQINNILDIGTGKKLGLIGEGFRSTVKLFPCRGKYQGICHFHPEDIALFLGAANFAVSARDRLVFKKDSINLLSFNMTYGPEIIAYNRQFTYIPANKDKTLLMKAGFREVITYLRR